MVPRIRSRSWIRQRVEEASVARCHATLYQVGKICHGRPVVLVGKIVHRVCAGVKVDTDSFGHLHGGRV